MPNLHDTLWDLTVEKLRYRLKFLSPKSKGTRKEDLIEGIKAALSGPGLLAALEELDETGRLAVTEAVYDPLYEHDEIRFHAKYGRDAEFYVNPKGEQSYYSWSYSETPTRLNLFFYHDPYSKKKTIPSDMAESLRQFIPAPAPNIVPQIPEPTADDDLWIRHSESEALAELPSMLRLAALGDLCFSEKIGLPAKKSLAGIEAALVGGDWFPPELIHPTDPKPWEPAIGPIKPVAWVRLLQAAGLVKMIRSKSTLTPQGRRAVEKPAWETICGIWQKWTSNKIYDEFNRIDLIKGQSVKGSLTAAVPRRTALLAALEKCPPGEWIPFDGFSRYMRADDFIFEVSPDPWKLYIAEKQYGSLGYDGASGWDVLQDRYLMCLLMEYAATLGLIDIAYKIPNDARPADTWGADDYEWLSRYDGLEAFRINPLGEYVFGGGKGDFQPSQVVPEVHLTASNNLTIRVASGRLSPVERLQLETWAEPQNDETFLLNETRAIEAIESGHDPDDFARFLQERDREPLPETVVAFLKQARENGNAVRQSGNAILFECRDARTAEMICSRKGLANISLRASETTLAVREKDLAKFQKQIRSLGLGIR